MIKKSVPLLLIFLIGQIIVKNLFKILIKKI